MGKALLALSANDRDDRTRNYILISHSPLSQKADGRVHRYIVRAIHKTSPHRQIHSTIALLPLLYCYSTITTTTTQSLPHRATVATPAAVLQCLIRGIPPAMQRHYSRGKSARKMTLILYRRSNEEKQRNQQTPEALYRHPASRLVSLRPRFTSPRLA